MNIVKNAMVVFVLISGTISGMQQKNQISALPNELQLAIAAQSGTSLPAICSNVRALICSNTSLNKNLNSELNTIRLMDLLAGKFGTTRLEAALQLRTIGAAKWLKRSIAEDKNNEFAKEVIKNFEQSLIEAQNTKSASHKRLLTHVALEGNWWNYTQQLLREHEGDPMVQSQKHNQYRIVEFILKTIPTLVHQKPLTGANSYLMASVYTACPDLVELFLQRTQNKHEIQKCLDFAENRYATNSGIYALMRTVADNRLGTVPPEALLRFHVQCTREAVIMEMLKKECPSAGCSVQ